jgi:hypothetical protein
MRTVFYCLFFLSCDFKKPVPDAGVPQLAVPDGGWQLTETNLGEWLQWTATHLNDAGAASGQVKHDLARFHLTVNDVIQIEEVVNAVVTERTVAKISGADAVNSFRAGLKNLPDDVRVKAEQALNDARSKTARVSLGAVEKKFGANAVQLILSREEEVTNMWNAQFGSRKK